MADIGEESVAVMLRLTESLMLAPATDMLKYCLDGVASSLDKAGGAATQTIKAGAATARNALDNHGHAGQVSMKRLVADAEGAELVSIPIEATDLKAVQSHLKSYGVTFAIMEHPATGALTAHFKAKSVDQVAAALRSVISMGAENVQDRSIENDRQGGVEEPKEADSSVVRYGQLEMDGTLFKEWHRRAIDAENRWMSDHSTNETEWAAKIESALSNGETSFEFEHEEFDLSPLLASGAVKLAEGKKEPAQSRESLPPEWLEIGDQELCEMDNLILTVERDGTARITAVDEQGGEVEVFSERCPIPSPVMAKSFALAQASRFKGKSADELKEISAKEATALPTKEVLAEARERATKRNDELAQAPKGKSVERSEPAR